MKWIVCIKQVPETTEVRIDRQTNNLLREEVGGIMNPFDRHALEAAVQLREQHGGKVTAITMGPPKAEECLRDALALGADEAFLLSDPAFRGADTLATSYTLAAAIQQLKPFRLILCGKQAVDGDTAQVGPELAEWLGLPQVTGVDRLTVESDRVIAWREQEDGHYEVEAPLPALVTVTKKLNEPGLPTVTRRLWANREVIPVWGKGDIPVHPSRIGLSGSPTQVRRIFFPEHSRQGQVFQGTPEELTDRLMEVLNKQGII